MVQVLAVLDNGGFAQQIAVSEAAALKLPEGVDVAAAAGFPVTFGTAYLALVERAHIRKGHTVVVLGAGGGVGTAAVQVTRPFSDLFLVLTGDPVAYSDAAAA